jgi:hypothetical protein
VLPKARLRLRLRLALLSASAPRRDGAFRLYGWVLAAVMAWCRLLSASVRAMRLLRQLDWLRCAFGLSRPAPAPRPPPSRSLRRQV